MSDAPSHSVTGQVAGNVRIEVLPDQLTVTMPAERSAREFLACGFVLLVILILFNNSIFHYLVAANLLSAALVERIGPYIKPAPSIFSPFVSLFICCLVMGQTALEAFRRLLGGRQTLLCTRNRLELTDADFGRIWRRRAYTRKGIEEIAFRPPGFTIGARSGLSYLVAGKRVKVFSGLRAPEAERILTELKRLGFDTVHDPQMLLLVEMEQTRRKYVFPIFR
jgi:hypothetical protein